MKYISTKQKIALALIGVGALTVVAYKKEKAITSTDLLNKDNFTIRDAGTILILIGAVMGLAESVKK